MMASAAQQAGLSNRVAAQSLTRENGVALIHGDSEALSLKSQTSQRAEIFGRVLVACERSALCVNPRGA
jgi:hypothetical protein